MNRINIPGIDSLSPEDREKALQISQKNFEKMQRTLHNITAMEIKINTHNQKGNNRKFSIISSINLGSRKFEANAEDWKILNALKKSLTSLSNEIEHSFHISGKTQQKENRKTYIS